MSGPRSYRPQRVVSMLEKDSRPQFAGRVLASPVDVVEGLAEFIGGRANEVFLVLYVNVRNQLVGFTELTEASPIGVSVNPQGIFAAALASNAAAILTVHQHPSGNATPSVDDERLWERLGKAGELLGVPVLDNLIVTRTHYYSQGEGSVLQIPARIQRQAAEKEGA